jgi:hypothetical protein
VRSWSVRESVGCGGASVALRENQPRAVGGVLCAVRAGIGGSQGGRGSGTRSPSHRTRAHESTQTPTHAHAHESPRRIRIHAHVHRMPAHIHTFPRANALTHTTHARTHARTHPPSRTGRI